MGKNKKKLKGGAVGGLKERLDAIISLLIDPPKSSTIYDKSVRLRYIGLKNSEIAKILGKTETHIGKELSLGKKVKYYGRKRN